MEIELKTGKIINLEVTPLILEYIGDYEGGIEQLERDANGEKDKNGYTKTMYATNQLLYAIIASNSDEPLTYRQAVRLVKLEDVSKIIKFITQNTPKVQENQQNITTQARIINHRF